MRLVVYLFAALYFLFFATGGFNLLLDEQYVTYTQIIDGEEESKKNRTGTNFVEEDIFWHNHLAHAGLWQYDVKLYSFQYLLSVMEVSPSMIAPPPERA